MDPLQPDSDYLHRLAEIASRRADHCAVESAQANLTYAQLDQLANQLAHHLIALGVKRETLVGISLPRGAFELVAILAVAKAGGAYVPLDPSHPPERLVQMVADARPRVLLVHPESSLDLTRCKVPHVIVTQDLEDATAGHPVTRPMVRHVPEQLAYVLFTSGSTGRPKGVEVTRGAFTNFLRSMAHTPGIAESDRLLAITTTAFDIAGLELFLPLWAGATVVIADSHAARDARLLRRLLETRNISMMQATPAMWRLLLQSGWRGDRKLRLLCGGEAMTRELADRLLAVGGELWNMYGPTETAVWSSLDRIVEGQGPITIGRPIDETEILILDEQLRPTPIGHEGEICIAGTGLARGYLGRDDLTAERFPSLPDQPGRRIYRTGDVGRQLHDGRFVCLGRLDHQIKIRGFRIELGEVEAVLTAVPGVEQSVVTAIHREDGDPSLVAYWVGVADRDALIRAARRQLPAYMIPSAYVQLDAFPLNTSGKIDRQRLPGPRDCSSAATQITRPRNDHETRIATIWRETLGLQDVPVDESFFHLGGTSALALGTILRIEAELGISVPIQAFFEAPTVQGLAARFGTRYAPDAPIVARLHRGDDDKEPLFCLLGVHVYQDLALAMRGDRTVIGIHVPFSHAPTQRPLTTLHQVAARYVEIIRQHQPAGPYHLLGFCFGGIVAYEAARQLVASGQSVPTVVVLDALLPSGVKIDWTLRLRNYSRRLLTDGPAAAAKLAMRLGRRVRRRWGRIVWPGPARKPRGTGELGFEGPAADAVIAEFAKTHHELDTTLLMVRATGESQTQWLHVADDYDWGGRARNLHVESMPCTHEELLREPFVRHLANAIGSLVTPSR